MPCLTEVPVLPGGGTVHTLDAQGDLRVYEQCTEGGTFRWLCSYSRFSRPSCGMLAESILPCLPPRYCTRSGGKVLFDRSSLLPQYHGAMVAGLGLHQGSMQRALLIGVGGGCLAMFLRRNHPEIALTCVDPNGTAIRLGQLYFGLEPSNRLRIIELTAERYLRQTSPSELFDAILVDTTEAMENRNGESGIVAPHYTFRQRRAILQLFGRLSARGVLLINVLGDDSSLHHLQGILTSVSSNHGVYRLHTDEGNVVLAAHAPQRTDGNNSAQHFPPLIWWEACTSIGLSVSSCSRG